MDTPIRQKSLNHRFMPTCGITGLVPSPLQMMTPPNSSSKEVIQKPYKKRESILPMIVDICIDDKTGNQLYQVHETKSWVRKEMPKSDFNSSSAKKLLDSQKAATANGIPDGGLQQISPNSLNKRRLKRGALDVEEEDSQFGESPLPAVKFRKMMNQLRNPDANYDTLVGKENDVNGYSIQSTMAPGLGSMPELKSGDNMGQLLPADDVIWSDDVEQLFIEALKIIPKNGLTKIKISGRTCGRNELISDFIMTKTGKHRTRKQVSSHIQVIKNMKKNKDLIELIKNGPSDPSLLLKFNEIFGKITFQKSIGACGAIANISSPPQEQIPRFSDASNPQLFKQKESLTKSLQKRLRRMKLANIATPSSGMIESNIDFKVFKDKIPTSDDQHATLKSLEFTFTPQGENLEAQVISGIRQGSIIESPIKIKSNANFGKRFPELLDLIKTNEKVPIQHALCNLNLPYQKNFDISHGTFQSRLQVVVPTLTQNEMEKNHFQCITTIYSFGKKLSQSSEWLNPKFDQQTDEVSFNIKFATEFWVAFTHMLKKNHDQNCSTNNNQGSPFGGVDNNEDEDASGDETIEVDELMEETIHQKQKTAIRGVTIKQVILSTSSKKYTRKTDMKSIDSRDIKTVLLWEFNDVSSKLESYTTLRQLYLPSPLSIDPKVNLSLNLVEASESDQLPTPKTASMMSFDKDAPPPSASSEMGFGGDLAHVRPPLPPISTIFNSSRSLLTQSSMPNLFTTSLNDETPNFVTMNQMRSLSMNCIISHPLSPQNSSQEEDDDMCRGALDTRNDNSNDQSSSRRVGGLMIQTLGSDELFSDPTSHDQALDMGEVCLNSIGQQLSHQSHQSSLLDYSLGQTQHQLNELKENSLHDSMMTAYANKDDLGVIFKQESFFW